MIPGFEGQAAIVELDYGVWRYRHPGRTGTSSFYTLAEAFASVTAGKEIRLAHRPKHALWKRRLLIETGCVSMAPILLPTLPPALTWVPKVLTGFVMLLQVRRLTEPTTEGVPFSIRFAADWTGTSFDAAADAIRWLVKNDFLIKREELEAKNDHDHGAYVYRLAEGR